MMLILHVCIAISSILQTSYMLIAPSKLGLRISYTLMGLTLTSGTYLILSTGTHMLEACLMGVVYIGFAAYGIVRTQRTLAKNAAI
jgi:hypothetical protein